ncbi:hypothetical protein SH449x_001357 [Pirellulaceae bacterium SH449]
MKACILSLVLLCEVGLIHSALLGQGAFQGTSKDEAMECVTDFVANREKYPSFLCAFELDKTYASGTSQNESRTRLILSEDSESKRTRMEIEREGFAVGDDFDMPIAEPLLSIFDDRGKRRFFLQGAEQRFGGGLPSGTVIPNPWMVPICGLASLESGTMGLDGCWINILDETKLLWAESDGTHVRGEWSFGSGVGECYIQVYFSSKFNNLPVFVRYIRPKDKDKPFEKVGITFVSENEITWKPYRDGFVPVEVKMYRESYWSSKPGIKSTNNHVYRFSWKTPFVNKDGEIDPDVFVPGKIDFEKLQSSFEKL